MKLCQRVLDGKEISNEWQTSVLVLILKGKEDVVKRVLDRRIRELLNIDAMHLGSMFGRGTTDALFVMRRMQEKYKYKWKKFYICFVDIEMAFYRLPRKVME